ncbi:MAG: UDP-3-O-acyl-N-acetylglucosamine deacetylase, partial [Candidatus Omnitrophica bacterium]|nr:UDP-3-O-acyl-N-acetylglucosamine deacetylase [Candidatus Omnitrophota bacterium]
GTQDFLAKSPTGYTRTTTNSDIQQADISGTGVIHVDPQFTAVTNYDYTPKNTSCSNKGARFTKATAPKAYTSQDVNAYYAQGLAKSFFEIKKKEGNAATTQLTIDALRQAVISVDPKYADDNEIKTALANLAKDIYLDNDISTHPLKDIFEIKLFFEDLSIFIRYNNINCDSSVHFRFEIFGQGGSVAIIEFNNWYAANSNATYAEKETKLLQLCQILPQDKPWLKGEVFRRTLLHDASASMQQAASLLVSLQYFPLLQSVLQTLNKSPKTKQVIQNLIGNNKSSFSKLSTEDISSIIKALGEDFALTEDEELMLYRMVAFEERIDLVPALLNRFASETNQTIKNAIASLLNGLEARTDFYSYVNTVSQATLDEINNILNISSSQVKGVTLASGIILISKDQTNDEMNATFIHEVDHLCFNHIYNTNIVLIDDALAVLSDAAIEALRAAILARNRQAGEDDYGYRARILNEALAERDALTYLSDVVMISPTDANKLADLNNYLQDPAIQALSDEIDFITYDNNLINPAALDLIASDNPVAEYPYKGNLVTYNNAAREIIKLKDLNGTGEIVFRYDARHGDKQRVPVKIEVEGDYILVEYFERKIMYDIDTHGKKYKITRKNGALLSYDTSGNLNNISYKSNIENYAYDYGTTATLEESLRSVSSEVDNYLDILVFLDKVLLNSLDTLSTEAYPHRYGVEDPLPIDYGSNYNVIGQFSEAKVKVLAFLKQHLVENNISPESAAYLSGMSLPDKVTKVQPLKVRHSYTVTEPTTFEGRKIIDSNEVASMRLLPAEPGAGIVYFVNYEEGGQKKTVRLEFSKAQLEAIKYPPHVVLKQKINGNSIVIHLPEHMHATLNSLGIYDVYIETTGKINEETKDIEVEIPTNDGSSRFIADHVLQMGIAEQVHWFDSYINIQKPIYFRTGDGREYLFLPDDQLKLTYAMDFPQEMLGRKIASFDLSEKDPFSEIIAQARTFIPLSLVQKGFYKGVSLDNLSDSTVLVYDDETGAILNRGGYRFQNEAPTHKILDLLGDLDSMNLPLKGQFISYKGGHPANRELVSRIIGARQTYKPEIYFDRINNKKIIHHMTIYNPAKTIFFGQIIGITNDDSWDYDVAADQVIINKANGLRLVASKGYEGLYHITAISIVENKGSCTLNALLSLMGDNRFDEGLLSVITSTLSSINVNKANIIDEAISFIPQSDLKNIADQLGVPYSNPLGPDGMTLSNGLILLKEGAGVSTFTHELTHAIFATVYSDPVTQGLITAAANKLGMTVFVLNETLATLAQLEAKAVIDLTNADYDSTMIKSKMQLLSVSDREDFPSMTDSEFDNLLQLRTLLGLVNQEWIDGFGYNSSISEIQALRLAIDEIHDINVNPDLLDAIASSDTIDEKLLLLAGDLLHSGDSAKQQDAASDILNIASQVTNIKTQNILINICRKALLPGVNSEPDISIRMELADALSRVAPNITDGDTQVKLVSFLNTMLIDVNEVSPDISAYYARALCAIYETTENSATKNTIMDILNKSVLPGESNLLPPGYIASLIKDKITGAKKMLWMDNIGYTMGDEIIRAEVVLPAVLSANPGLEITLYTAKPFLYNHPRLRVI